MIIEKVIICGFKSFGPIEVHFYPNAKFNALIGAKNHGKTNMIDAIEFALNLSFIETDLHSFIHDEFANNNMTMTYVEIVLDNGNALIPNQKNDISIRREIIDGKLKYKLDGNEIDRIELKNILGLLGFSKSYPFYFFIKQSNIVEMATADSVQLLHILKQMAGFDDFHQAKKKCYRIIQETNDELESVSNLLSKINIHLEASETTLNASEYVKLLRQKNTIEVVLEKKKLIEWQHTMDALNAKRCAIIDHMENNATQMSSFDNQIKENRSSVKLYNSQCNTLKNEEDALNANKNQIQLAVQKFDTFINTLRQQVGNFDQQKQFLEEYKEFLERNIKAKSEEHVAIQTELAQRKQTIANYSTTYNGLRREYDNIFATHLITRGIRNLFHSANERNEWINQRIAVINKNLAELSADIKKSDMEIRREQEKENGLQTDIDQAQATFNAMMEKREREMEEKKHFAELKRKIATLEFEHRQILSQKGGIMRDLTDKQRLFHNANCELKQKIGPAIYNGIESVRTITKENAELSKKYYGLIIERFTCDADLHKIIDVVAKTKIFYHIVDTDQTATKILKAMNQKNLPGSPIFMPMNRIQNVDSPITDKQRGVINRLTFDPEFASIMRNIFGRVLICRDLEHAAQEGRTRNGVKCVTLSGDMVEPFGAMTGGYILPSSLCIEKYLNAKACDDMINGLNTQLVVNSQKASELTDEIAILNISCREMSGIFQENDVTIKNLQLNLNGLKRRIKTLQTRIQKKEERLIINQSKRTDLIDEKNLLEAELTQPILNADDQLKADNLKAELDAVQSKFFSEKNRYAELEQMNTVMVNFLKNDLQKKHVDNCKQLQYLQSSMKQLQTFEELKNKKLTELIDVDSRISANQANSNGIIDECRTNNQDIQIMMATKKDLKKSIEADQTELDPVNKQCSELEKQIKELEVRVSSLTLPDECVPQNYENMSDADLNADLIMVQEKIINCSGEGFPTLKECIDRFNADKIKLQDRKADMKANDVKIRNSIENMTKQFGESIRQIFTELRGNFLKIFKKFAPCGYGKLILNEMESNANGNNQINDIDQFTGIDVRVSFFNCTDLVDMSQLTDEQKSAVALVLILAIQKCARSPFYLFDCIERSLTIKYKKAILSILRELSAESQVIAMIDDVDILNECNSFYRLEKDESDSTCVSCISKSDADYLLRNNFQ